MRSLLAITVFSILLFGFTTREDNVFNVSRGSIDFRSDAPLELIKASSSKLRGKFDPVRKQFAFTVKVNSFEGFNSPLQKEHFNENYMESDKFPDANFSGRIIEDIDITKDGVYTIRAKGNLVVHGVSKERIIKSQLTISGKQINIQSNFTVLLNDHNILIPKVVHENLASEIKVEVKAELAK